MGPLIQGTNEAFRNLNVEAKREQTYPMDDKIKRILLTGSTGFIGSELVPKLIALGYEVHLLERYVTSRYTLDNNNAIKHYGNLTDYPSLKNIVRQVQPEFCIHLGAISAVSFSYDHFLEVSEVDYLGTINLAEACYREVPSFKQFIFAGSSEEFGMTLQNNRDKLNEDSKLEPNSPYAIAKVSSELYLKYMWMAYNFPYTVLRPFNSYGRKSNNHFFIERTITQMLAGGKVSLGDPSTTRNWLYVDDHVNGYLKALDNPKAIAQTIQLCSDDNCTTQETAMLIAELTGFKGTINWNSTPKRPLDAKYLIGDNSKAKTLLDWAPTVSLRDGLIRLISYYNDKRVAISLS